MTPVEQQALEFRNIVRAYQRSVELDGAAHAMYTAARAIEEACERLSRDQGAFMTMLDGLV